MIMQNDFDEFNEQHVEYVPSVKCIDDNYFIVPTLTKKSSNISNESAVFTSSEENAIEKNLNSFPEVEECIPKWKRKFPWVVWNSVLRIICCSICHNICLKVTNKVLIIKKIISPDEVFTISKTLREHADTDAHCMAIFLNNKNIFSTLHFILSYHFNEFNSISELLTTIENLTGQIKDTLTVNLLKKCIRMLGSYFEDKTILYLKKVEKFSVITDPCQGLLIVRWLNENQETEEHILSSFMRKKHTSPTQYLSKLGINIHNIVAYISNSICKECKSNRKEPFKMLKTPLRLPQIDRYLVFLWRSKLLKPFYSIGCILSKLWLKFPYAISDTNLHPILNNLTKFTIFPTIFLDIFSNINKFKKLCSSIYCSTGSIEALGFVAMDVSNLSKLLDIFPILASINKLFISIKFDTNCMTKKLSEKLELDKSVLKKFCISVKCLLVSDNLEIPGIELNDIDDFYKLVELTINEYVQPIYSRGKIVQISYWKCSTHQNLEEYNKDAQMRNSFHILYTALKKPNFQHENTELLKSLKLFLNEFQHLENKDANSVMKYFHENKKIKTKHKVAFDFYEFVALFAFNIANNECNIYEIKICEFLFQRSIWYEIGEDTIIYLLSIVSELSNKNKLIENDIQKWWLEKNEDLLTERKAIYN